VVGLPISTQEAHRNVSSLEESAILMLSDSQPYNRQRGGQSSAPAVPKAIELGATNLREIAKASVDLFATRNVFQNVPHSASSPHRNRITRIELSIVEIEL
jgi:hypothetical protein